MTVRQLLHHADSREIAEWMAFARIDREDYEDSSRQRDLAVEAQTKLARKTRGRG